MKTTKSYMMTLSSCIASAEKKGFTSQFKVNELGILSLATQKLYTPEQVSIAHFYRFEGDSNPDDCSILYALEMLNCERGTLVDAYGVSNDPMITEFMSKVKRIHK
jgi:hypothetical protein